VHDHLRKGGQWNPDELPHDIPHHSVVPKSQCDFYKRRRAEADVEEEVIGQCRAIVDDLEGLGEPKINPVKIANQQMEEMISDLHQECDRQSRS
jgi:hypothetical protein